MSQTVRAQQPTSDLRQVAATSGARLFAAYWSCLAAVDLTRAAPGPLRLGVVVVLVVACSLHQAVGTAGAIGVVGWLFVDGFVSHAHGVLALDGAGDVVRLVLLVAVALAAACRTRSRGA
ncbi:MAG: hypothetical protein ABIQ59_05700 [Nocardioidaceae bacterium]